MRLPLFWCTIGHCIVFVVGFVWFDCGGISCGGVSDPYLVATANCSVSSNDHQFPCFVLQSSSLKHSPTVSSTMCHHIVSISERLSFRDAYAFHSYTSHLIPLFCFLWPLFVCAVNIQKEAEAQKQQQEEIKRYVLAGLEREAKESAAADHSNADIYIDMSFRKNVPRPSQPTSAPSRPRDSKRIYKRDRLEEKRFDSTQHRHAAIDAFTNEQLPSS